ncbi:spore germination protein [Cohnella zeiphila]|uniref:Spore germination protein n=1 Tax=Cohnella zeiphila TaxID=2761120 RepID=A0A7X0VUD7_9BACL|nr:spore germination protein [Cohnella zeiphila]MBB6730300.1 spore germination protein [Cohnella zeiphila]
MSQSGHEWFDADMRNCNDVIVHRLRESNGEEIAIAYADQLIDDRLLKESIIPRMRRAMAAGEPVADLFPFEALPADDAENRSKIFVLLFSGSLLVFRKEDVLAYSIAKLPGRQPEESSTEISVKGPKDGFVEELAVNLALIRKRVKTADLKIEKFTVGTETRTDVAMLYLEGMAKPRWVEEGRKRIRNVHVRALNGAAEIEEMLSDVSISLFPQIDYAGRPDSATFALLNGSILFMMDGVPLVYLAPINLLSLLRSPEDNYTPYYYASLEKIIRIVALFTTLFLPGFWVALSAYNIDQLPFPLLSTIIMSRIGLPMSTTIEMLLMLAMFEVFREAGVRLPKAVGQTVAVVGGIIVGDAAIRAGMASPTMLVVSALTSVCSFTLVNVSLSGAVTLARLFVLFLSMTFGMFGFFVSLLALLMYLVSLRSFGEPYLFPIAPISFRKLPSTFFKLPTRLAGKPYGPVKNANRRKR